MSDLFGVILAAMQCNIWENKSIPSLVSRGTLTPLKKEPKKENLIMNFRPITLLDVDLKVEKKLGLNSSHPAVCREKSIPQKSGGGCERLHRVHSQLPSDCRTLF